MGTGSLLGYGRNDQFVYELKELAQRASDHLAQARIDISEDCGLHGVLEERHKNLFQKTQDLLKHYPSEVFNLFTGLAGACITASALRYKVLRKAALLENKFEQVIFNTPKELKQFRTAGWLDVGLGSLTMASTAIGGLVQEKAHDPDQPRATGWKGVVEWFLRASAYGCRHGLMESTGMHAASSALEYQQCKRLGYTERLSAIKNRAWFVGSNLLAEALVAISSKGHGEGVVTDKERR